MACRSSTPSRWPLLAGHLQRCTWPTLQCRTDPQPLFPWGRQGKLSVQPILENKSGYSQGRSKYPGIPHHLCIFEKGREEYQCRYVCDVHRNVLTISNIGLALMTGTASSWIPGGEQPGHRVEILVNEDKSCCVDCILIKHNWLTLYRNEYIPVGQTVPCL